MLYTKRLRLVPITRLYSKDIFNNLWSDYDVVKYTNMPLMTHYEQCHEKIDALMNNKSYYGCPNNFVILLEDEFIGITGFPSMDKIKKEYGLYYQISKVHWGKGYGSEAAEALIKYIFEKSHDINLFATSVSVNSASIKILEKLGFIEITLDKKAFKGFDIIHFKYTK